MKKLKTKFVCLAIVLAVAVFAVVQRHKQSLDYCESKHTSREYMVVMGKIYCHTGNNVYVR
jgi:hypothetical protein